MNPNTFNAWHIVALGAGAFVVHAYHIVVNAGGLKRIWSNFWNGPVPPTTAAPVQKSP